jgi:hypothetical protein
MLLTVTSCVLGAKLLKFQKLKSPDPDLKVFSAISIYRQVTCPEIIPRDLASQNEKKINLQ